MVKINEYVDTIIEFLKENNYYSEISESKLRCSIRDYLMEEHDKDMEVLSVKLELEEINGVEIDKNWYKKEYQLIKDRLFQRAQQISASDSTSKSFIDN